MGKSSSALEQKARSIMQDSGHLMMVKGPEHRKFRPRIEQDTGTAIHSLQAVRDFLTLTPWPSQHLQNIPNLHKNKFCECNTLPAAHGWKLLHLHGPSIARLRALLRALRKDCYSLRPFFSDTFKSQWTFTVTP